LSRARDHHANGHDRCINREDSQAANRKEELSGRDNGTQFILRPEGTAELFQQFNTV
jgi:hypothetical protein